MSVAPKPLQVYDQPHQFEPLLPRGNTAELVEKTRSLVMKSIKLHRGVHASTRDELRELTRSMGSYYSNQIEGQGTHPLNIDRALHADFSDSPDVALKQRLALAHIDAERELEAAQCGEGATAAMALRTSFAVDAHRSLYGRLSESDRTTGDGRIVQPGALRAEDVSVGRLQPPTAASIPLFLARMDEVYPKLVGLDAVGYTVAAAHHRLAWVHPFGDGNGRTCRLQTHCALLPVTAGLWSVSRGLSRNRQRYYEALGNADMARQGDHDGRGNLSERMLRQWCHFFIDICHDQVDFMTRVLDLDTLRDRVAELIAARVASPRYKNYDPAAILPMQYVIAAGPLPRGDFARMTGLSDRSASRVIARLLADGLLRSKTPKGAVGIGLPLDALAILLPNLYPEAAMVNLEY
ncbi:MAG: filamentation induced by cAMP protein Fic [Rhizobacter sp.]|nr:filamentation induced by cAMP protein Fic [Rhizobacter sp.]